MSDKKSSKSKSKQKVADKPPKDAKSKKGKQDKGDTKSKKSVQKAEKPQKGSKAGSKADKKSKAPDNLDNSRISKVDDLGSQSNFSIFKPFNFQPPPTKIDQSLCPYHNEPNSIFCQVCQQVGCQSCLVYGPHNNQMHRITKIDQAFKARYLFLNQLVCKDLLNKRDKINGKLEEMNILCDQLRYVKSNIEKQTKLEYNETMEKLSISAGGKFAILNHQMASLQQDLQSINLLGNQFFQLTNLHPESSPTPQPSPLKGMVPFLLRSRILHQQSQQLISKPIKTSVQIYPYDLPRTVTQRKLILQKNKPYLDLLQVKDEVIWELLEERKKVKDNIWEGFKTQAEEEVREWEKLNLKLREQIEGFQRKCRRCGVELGEGTVNGECGDGWHVFQ